MRLRPPNGNPSCVKTSVEYGAAACCLTSWFGWLSSCRNLPDFFFRAAKALASTCVYWQKLSLTELNLLSARGARRRQPSQSSLRYQQKKALNVLIRPIYRHDRIGKCGISGVAMMGAGPLLLFFIATQKYVENGHRFSRGRRNRFLHH